MPRRHILIRRRTLPVINAKATQPGGLTSGSARSLMSRIVGHVAASGLRLGGEQKRMRTGPPQAEPGHVSTLDHCLGPVQGLCMFLPGTLGPPCGDSDPIPGGPDPTLGV
jgi:hypothetical protein